MFSYKLPKISRTKVFWIGKTEYCELGKNSVLNVLRAGKYEVMTLKDCLLMSTHLIVC